MSSGTKDISVKGRVHFILMETTQPLSGQDLLRITEIAEQAHAEIHISYGPWQVLGGIPESSQWFVKDTLEDLGYWCFNNIDGFIELHIFDQRKRAV